MSTPAYEMKILSPAADPWQMMLQSAQAILSKHGVWSLECRELLFNTLYPEVEAQGAIKRFLAQGISEHTKRLKRLTKEGRAGLICR